MKYLVTVLSKNKEGNSANTDLYYTTKKKLDTEERIEEMRQAIKEKLQILHKDKGVVILNIFGPLKDS